MADDATNEGLGTPSSNDILIKTARRQLTDCVSSLTGKYLSGGAEKDFALWPTVDELNQLTQSIRILYEAQKRYKGKRQRPKQRFFAGNRLSEVDGRNSKIGLRAFTDGLLAKLERMEISPYYKVMSVIKHLKKDPKAQERLAILSRLFFDDNNGGLLPINTLTTADAEKTYHDLRALTSPEFLSSFKRPASMSELDFNDTLKPILLTLTWAAYVDIYSRQQRWCLRYYPERQSPSIAFLYVLQDVNYDTSLRQRFYGSAWTPETYQRKVKTVQARTRKQNSRYNLQQKNATKSA